MNEITPYQNDVDLTALDRYECSESYRRKLKIAVNALLRSGIDFRNPKALHDYTNGLPVSSRAFLRAGLKILFADVATQLKANARPQNIATIQAALYNLEAMTDSIHVRQPERERVPVWLDQDQIDRMVKAALDNRLRDYIIIAMLAGTGIRRQELAALTWDKLSTMDGRPVWTIKGKGGKTRTLPIPEALYRHLMEWQQETGRGLIARRYDKHGHMGKSLSTAAIFDLVRMYGKAIGVENLQPHDLRRSFARLVYQATHDIIKVQDLLGHADPRTTKKYIGADIDLEPVEIIRDYVPTVYGD